MITAVTCLLIASAAIDTPLVERVALVVGMNDGGASRPTLRYAEKDARDFAAVLGELSGVDGDRLRVLEGVTRSQLLANFESMGSSTTRREFIFYYSGHSDERGLLLGEEVLGYRELKAAVANVDAEVHVAILDSCSSGVLTRLKGGSHVSPFLVDESNAVEGYAFLTSASADEAAQESDAVGGSFFTHYLISGLRGAADTSGDSVVSLGEAYQYAFDETLRRTESSASGPQHASYDIQLSGTGDLVLADLRQASSGLVIDPAIAGRVFIRDTDGLLLAEFRKRPGRASTVRLPAGGYDVTVDDMGALLGAEVAVPEGEQVALLPAALSSREREQTVARGPAPVVRGEDVLTARPLTVQELETLRERGELLLYTGIASMAIGGCCMIGGGIGMVAGAFSKRDIGDDPATQGCALLGSVMTAGGIGVAVVGNKRLSEADEVPVEAPLSTVKDPVGTSKADPNFKF